MLRPRSRRKPLGVTLVEIMTVTAILSGLNSQSNFRYAIHKANEIKGLNNLKQIYLLLQTQCIAGGLPNAAFYPEGDPRKDPKSIVRLISGAPPQLFISPFAPDALQEKGLTYAWNNTLNGKTLDVVPGTTWVMIDMTAFIADPNLPKPSRYLVLYANGRAEAVSEPPSDILKAVREAEAKKRQTPPAKSVPKRKAPTSQKSAPSSLPKVRLPGGQTVPMPPSLPGI